MPTKPPYNNIFKYLSHLEKYGVRLGLTRIKTLLKSLGDPQDKLNIIHIGGTNGKGSTSAMIESILKEAGYTVGLYTSPHLVQFNERIMVNGKEITDKKMAELAERVKKKSEVRSQKSEDKERQSPTFFEFATAMAFLYFAEEKVDFAVMEVGLGGRLDATNVGSPLVSVITNIAKDHEAILGRRIKDIAFEKAGIIKRGGVLISGATKPAALKVLAAECKNKKAKFYRLNKDFFIDENRESGVRRFIFKGRRWILKDLETNLLGRHQQKNAACALAALEVLQGKGFCVSESAVRNGLKNVSWPGRLEIVSKRPLIVLDCAHNPAGAEVLKEEIISRIGHVRHIFLVLGIMSDKDIRGILSKLAPLADTVILTRPKTERAASLEMLYKEIMELRITNYELRIEGTTPLPPLIRGNNRKSKIVNRKLKIMLIDDVGDACRTAISLSKAADMICITGSVFTVGEARDALLEMVQ